MPKLTLRRGVWSAVGLVAVGVISLSAYLLTYKHPAPQANYVSGGVRTVDPPEVKELKTNLPLKPKSVTQEKARRVLELSSHPDVMVRSLSLMVLGCADDAIRGDVEDVVVARLRDPDVLVRASAINALASLQAKDRIPDIVPYLNDPDLRNNARRALARLGHPVE